MTPRTAVAVLFPCLLGALAAQHPGALVERGSSLLQVVEPDASERNLRMTPVVRAVQRTADSVVSIYLQSTQALARGGMGTEGQGSGVILDESGLVITNWHVVQPMVQLDSRERELELAVKLRDGRTRPAQVLSSSATHDLALLQLTLGAGETVKAAEIGRSSDLMIGETLIAIGNPQGHANTVTSGVLSATGRTIQVRAPDGAVRSYSDLLQTDAAINQGNSGGALLDITGKLVGINNAMAMGAENIGFAIPMDTVRQVFERELIQSENIAGSATTAWLGLEVAERDGAVVIADVVPDGPAARAGLTTGDVLLNVGDREVHTNVDYLRRIVTAKPREPLAVGVRRDGKEVRVTTTPWSRSDAAILGAIGAELEEVDSDADAELVRRTTLAFYRDSGMRKVPMLPAVLRIQGVQTGSPAEAIGLQKDDILLGVFVQGSLGSREVPLTSVREFAALLERQRGRTMRLAVLRGDEDLVGTIDVRAARR